MESYGTRLKKHLANYKQTHLRVAEDGIWKRNGKLYNHILPERLKSLNILETIRLEFWAFKKHHSEIKLHSDFHHLNSSQAMCFNLFFPFLGMPNYDVTLLLHALNLPISKLRSWGFERILNEAEGTNFDLCLEFESGARTLFEVKLSEAGFGKAKYDTRHKEKLDTIYYPALEGKITPHCFEPAVFFENYQLLRNVAYADAESRVIFLYPCANTALEIGKKFLDEVLTPRIESVVSVMYIEDVLRKLHLESARKLPSILTHLTFFEEKYIVPYGSSDEKIQPTCYTRG